MQATILRNPFVVGKYISDHYFCDREQETQFLAKQLENGRNVALISSRRIGKSGLIHHLFNQSAIKEQYYVFFVDLYATNSLAELVYALGKEIYEQLKPVKTQWKEKFFQIVSSFRVGFKLDAMDHRRLTSDWVTFRHLLRRLMRYSDILTRLTNPV